MVSIKRGFGNGGGLRANVGLFGIIGLVFLLIISLVFYFNFIGFTGKVSFSLGDFLDEGDELVISLQEGELIPAGARIMVESRGNISSYPLSNFMQSNGEGTYFLEGYNLNESGEGYGVEGAYNSYPRVSFILLISEAIAEIGGGSGGSDENLDESEEGNISEELEEPGVDNSSSEDSEETTVGDEEEVLDEGDSGDSAGSVEGTGSVIDSGESSEDEEGAGEVEAEEPETLITGDIIYNAVEEVPGSVTYNEDFSYFVGNKSVGFKPGSISVEGEGNVDYAFLDLDLNEGEVIVSTDYLIEEKGFGEKYLGESYEIKIDLNELGLNLSEDAQISLVYGNETFASAGYDSESSEVIPEEPNQIAIEALTPETVQYNAVVGKPVKWVKVIDVNDVNFSEGAVVEIPSVAENISVVVDEEVELELSEAGEEGEIELELREEKEAEEGQSSSFLTGMVTMEIDEEPSFLSKLVNFLLSPLSMVGNVILEEGGEETISVNVSEEVSNSNETVAVTYYTPAPISNETVVAAGEKRVVVSAPDEYNYSDILVYSSVWDVPGLDNVPVVGGTFRVEWYPRENVSLDSGNTLEEDVEDLLAVENVEEISDEVIVLSQNELVLYDVDDDGLVDFVGWVVPHLSAQTYELLLQTSLGSGLTGFWSFNADGGSNSSIAVDEQGVYNGTVTGATFQTSNCVIGECYSFNDTDTIDLSSLSNHFINGNNYTYAFWVNPTDCSGNQCDVILDGGWGINGIEIYVNTDNTIGVYDAADVVSSISTIPNSDWTHVAVVILYNNTGQNNYAKVYLNGALDNTDSFLGDSQNSTASSSISSSAIPMSGSIDEVYIYDRALLTSEIQDLYNFSSNESGVCPAGMVGLGTAAVPCQVTTCGTLDTAGTYTLYNDIPSTGETCFTIEADNIVLDLNAWSIGYSGASGGPYGIYVDGYDNITIQGTASLEEIYDWDTGIYFANSNNNLVSYVNILSPVAMQLDSNSTVSGVDFSGNLSVNGDHNTIKDSDFTDYDYGLILNGSNNLLLNNTWGISDSIVYLSGSNNRLVYNNSYGEIEFIDELNYNVPGAVTFPGDIEIENNSAYLNSTALSDLNKSANVTLRNTGILVPRILKDGAVCSDCVLLSSVGDTHTFNVSGWSTYTLEEQPAFIFQINTALASGTTYSFEAESYSNLDILWGDGSYNTSLSDGGTSSISHTYATEGVYNISLNGSMNWISLYDSSASGREDMIVDVLSNMSLGISGITNVNHMFFDADSITSFSEPRWFDDISVDINYMGSMFEQADSANLDTSGWDTSNVYEMQYMFDYAYLANPDTSNWVTSSVTDMSYMFNCYNGGCIANPDVSGWDTSSVENMNSMFTDQEFANPNVTNWNTSSVTDMGYMFHCQLASCAANPDVSEWDTALVQDMNSLFWNVDFNPNVTNWNTGSVTDMGMMFDNSQFNQNISGWDVSSVTDMGIMFGGSPFNQNISGWDVSSVTDMSGMFDSSAIDVTNYDALLIGWEALDLYNDINFGVDGLDYCLGESARAAIISDDSWTFSGDSKDCSAYTSLTECGTLDIAGETYTLQNDISVNGTCFNITANNVTLDFNGFSITGNGTEASKGISNGNYNYTTIYSDAADYDAIVDFDTGISLGGYYHNVSNIQINSYNSASAWGLLLGSDNSTVSNVAFNDNPFGLHLTGDYNTIEDCYFVNDVEIPSPDATEEAIQINGGSNNLILNNDFNTIIWELKYTSGSNNMLVYNNSYGEIAFLDQVDYDVGTAGANIIFGTENIIINNNSAYLDSSGFLDGELANKSANVTFLDTGIIGSQVILKDGVACEDCVMLSSSGDDYVFNVSGWSNYSVAGTVGDLTDVVIVNETGADISGGSGGTVVRGDDVTINATVTDADSVWITIWEGVIGGPVLLLDYLTNLVGNIWSITFGTNSTFNLGEVNYTIYANDTSGTETNQSGNFTISATKVSDCRELDQADTVYTLQNNVLAAGAVCFNVTANNVTLNGNGYNITGSNVGASVSGAVVINEYDNLYVYNVSVVSNFLPYAMRIIYSDNLVLEEIGFRDNTVGPSTTYGVNHTLKNLDLRDAIGFYTTSRTDNITFIYNNSFGTIDFFTENSFSGTGIFSWPGNISITSGNAYLNSADTFSTLEGYPLNITLRNTGISEGGAVFKDSDRCTDCTILSTAGDTYKFNITTWSSNSNYSIRDGRLITDCSTLDSTNTVYTLQNNILVNGTCFNITASNITLDGNGFSVLGNNSAGYPAITTPAYSNLTDLTIRGFANLSGFDEGIHFDMVNSSSVHNNTFDATFSSAVYGVYLEDSNSNTIENNSFTIVHPASGNYPYDSAGVYIKVTSGGISDSNEIRGNDIDLNTSNYDTDPKGVSLVTSGSASSNIIESNNITITSWNGNIQEYGVYLSSDGTLMNNNVVRSNDMVLNLNYTVSSTSIAKGVYLGNTGTTMNSNNISLNNISGGYRTNSIQGIVISNAGNSSNLNYVGSNRFIANASGAMVGFSLSNSGNFTDNNTFEYNVFNFSGSSSTGVYMVNSLAGGTQNSNIVRNNSFHINTTGSQKGIRFREYNSTNIVSNIFEDNNFTLHASSGESIGVSIEQSDLFGGEDFRALFARNSFRFNIFNLSNPTESVYGAQVTGVYLYNGEGVFNMSGNTFDSNEFNMDTPNVSEGFAQIEYGPAYFESNLFLNNKIVSQRIPKGGSYYGGSIDLNIGGGLAPNYLIYNNSHGEVKTTSIGMGLSIIPGETFNITESSISINESIGSRTMNLTFYNTGKSGFPRARLSGAYCSNCSRLASVSDSHTYSVLNFGNYTLDYQNRISLGQGWNMISLSVAEESGATEDVNISLEAGWNMVGYSGIDNVSYTDLEVDGASIALSVAVGKVQKQFTTLDSSTGKYRMAPYHASNIESGKAYWVYANESAILTIPNGKPVAAENETVSLSDIRFTNGSVEKNLTEAVLDGWLFGNPQYWDLDKFGGPGYRTKTLGDTLNSWSGVYIKTLNASIELVR
jgi:surface protein